MVKNFLIVPKNLQQMQKIQHRKGQFKKSAEATGDLIGNKIADKITSVSKNSWKELPNNETDKDVERPTHKKRCISVEEKKKLLNN